MPCSATAGSRGDRHHGIDKYLAIGAHGACLFPDSDKAMTWDVGDHGFTMSLSTKVPSLIAKNLRPWLDDWLAKHGETVSSVGSWAIHPGGPRVFSAVTEALGLDSQATAVSGDILARHGNMSSPTILFILDQLRADAPRSCVALAFGPGLAVEAACSSDACGYSRSREPIGTAGSRACNTV